LFPVVCWSAFLFPPAVGADSEGLIRFLLITI
jgi:hypothetical protein